MTTRRYRRVDHDLFDIDSDNNSMAKVFVMPVVSPYDWAEDLKKLQKKAEDEKKKKTKGKGGGGGGQKKKDNSDTDDDDDDDDDGDKKKKAKKDGGGGGGGGGDGGGGKKGKKGKPSIFSNLPAWLIVAIVALLIVTLLSLGQLRNINQQHSMSEHRLRFLEKEIERYRRFLEKRNEQYVRMYNKIYALQNEKYNLERLVNAPLTTQISFGISNVISGVLSTVTGGVMGLFTNVGDAMGSIGDMSRGLISNTPPYEEDFELYERDKSSPPDKLYGNPY